MAWADLLSQYSSFACYYLEPDCWHWLSLNRSLTMTESKDQSDDKTKSFVTWMLTFWKKKLSNQSLSFLNSSNSTVKFLNLLQQKLVKSIAAAPYWADNRIFCFVSLLKLVPTIFYQILLFHQMITLQKLWKMFVISSKKLVLFLRYSNFCNFSSSFPHFPDSK